MPFIRAIASVAWMFFGLSTRMLQLICATWFVASSSAWAADEKGRFLEFTNDFDTVTFDLSTVQITQPGRFTVVRTLIDNPDVMRFELKVLASLRTYCARADGQYAAPADLLAFGPPDLPVKNIEVRSDETRIAGRAYPFKMVSWDYPYKRFLLHPAGLHCKQYNRTENDLYSEARSLITNGLRSKDLYDCKRGLWGSLLNEDDDPAKAIVGPVPEGSRAFRFYLGVCGAVTHETPYIPQ